MAVVPDAIIVEINISTAIIPVRYGANFVGSHANSID